MQQKSKAETEWLERKTYLLNDFPEESSEGKAPCVLITDFGLAPLS